MARRATKGDEKPARWGGRPRPASAEPWIRLRVGRPAPPGGVSAECFFRRKYRNNCARHRRRSGKASIGGHRFIPERRTRWTPSQIRKALSAFESRPAGRVLAGQTVPHQFLHAKSEIPCATILPSNRNYRLDQSTSSKTACIQAHT